MRLTPAQRRTLVQCVRRQFGRRAKVSVHGSRVNDAAGCGDVDLVVERADGASAFARLARSSAQPQEAA